ncbi:hypothetical protein JCM19046_1876 [Bacillus sp. JCM 19046]|nr:hypothetical protein JCM19046_1876 [Bacillus sp. JCM 19046]
MHGVGALTVRFEENENEFKLFFSNPLNESHLLEFDNLFTPFYKADSSRSNLSSGLGLSIVQSLVEKMAGSAQAHVSGNQFSIQLTLPKQSKETTDER